MPKEIGKIGFGLWFAMYLLAAFVSYVTYNVICFLANTRGLNDYIDIYKFLGGKFMKIIILIIFFFNNIGTLLYAIFTYNELLSNLFS